MRTASRGGRVPPFRKRRTLLYEAASTSMAKVESGFAVTSRNGFSSISRYSSVLNPAVSRGTPWSAGTASARSRYADGAGGGGGGATIGGGGGGGGGGAGGGRRCAQPARTASAARRNSGEKGRWLRIL